jgi:hypothetical protein
MATLTLHKDDHIKLEFTIDGFTYRIEFHAPGMKGSLITSQLTEDHFRETFRTILKKLYGDKVYDVHRRS